MAEDNSTTKQPYSYEYRYPNFSGFNTLYNFRAANTNYGQTSRHYDFTNEPTFLTFSIDFNFDDAVSFGEVDTISDVYGEHILHAVSPLLNTNENYENAYNYLKYRNRFAEAKMLLMFVNKLKEITWYNPWFFQSLSSVNEAWKRNTDMSKPLKGSELQLTVETLESLDLSMSYIADLYRKFTYDQKFMREIIPDNLRWFAMNVYVCEFRNIRLNAYDENSEEIIHTGRTYWKKNETLTSESVMKDQYNWLDKAQTFHKYTFSMCEFDFSETTPYDTLSVGKIPDMASNKFKINPNWFVEENSYDLQTMFKDASFKEFFTRNNFSLNKPSGARMYDPSSSPVNRLLNSITTQYYEAKPTRSDNDNPMAARSVSMNNVSIDDIMNFGMYISNIGNRARNSVNGIKNTIDAVKSSVQYRVDQAKTIANNIKNLPNTISDIIHDITGKDNSKRKEPYSPQHMAVHETYNNEFAPINPNSTTSDVHEQSFGNNIGNATVSDIKEQIIGDTVGDVTLSDVKEQEFEDRIGNVTLSDVKEQEFEDKDPDAAKTDVQPQTFKPKNPDMAVSDVKEQEFDDVEPVITLSDVKEQEFDDKNANVTEAEEHFNEISSSIGMPTKSNVQENKINASSRPKPTKPLSAGELVETEFGTPGTPTVSIFQKIVEQKNRTLPENVTHSDHNAS